MVFIAISSVFVDGGFSTALVRKQDPSQADLSTVFYLNVSAALVLFAVLFVSAPYIASYYDEPLLVPVVRIVSLQFIIASLCTVQSILLVKKLDFRTQSAIHVVGVVVSGGVGVFFAFRGYGVMALVAQVLVQETVRAVLLWAHSTWRPSWVFSKESFRELFSFGSRLLASGLLNKVFDNLYPLVIGRYFSVVQLSYYSRANGYQALFSQNFTSMVNAVSFPTLVKFQDDNERLRAGLRKMNTLVMLVNVPVMLGLAVLAKPLIVLMITEKWLPVVPYLQWLCLAGLLYPMHVTNLNALNVKGRSDLFLSLEIVKKLFVLTALSIGFFWGLKGMVIGQVVVSVLAYVVNAYWPGKLIRYGIWGQLRDVLPIVLIACFMAGFVWFLGTVLPIKHAAALLFVQVAAGAFLYWVLAKAIRLPALLHLEELLRGLRRR